MVGYGHASVAEHAVLHVAFENVSRLAIECLESNRLASYTEKSTRYQKWESDDFHVPGRAGAITLCCMNSRACAGCSSGSTATLWILCGTWWCSARPGARTNRPRRWIVACAHSTWMSAGFLLPAAALANVGMTANARVLENALRKLLSHELQEVREIGEQLKAVALGEVPTLVKYAEAVPYLVETGRAACARRSHLVPKRLSREARPARRASWWTLTATVRTRSWRPRSIATVSCPSCSVSSMSSGLAREARERLADDLLGKLESA